MDSFNNNPSLTVAPVGAVVEMEEAKLIEAREVEDSLSDERVNSSLSSHIMRAYVDNREARQNSGIEDKMLESLRAYNGHYDPEDLRKIRETGGSDIFMNLTATKCRAAMSWIRDILMPANELAWALKPTPLPDIPEESQERIKKEIEQFVSDNLELIEQKKEEEDFSYNQQVQGQEQQQAQAAQAAQGQQGQGGQQPQAPAAPPIPKPIRAANEMRDINQMYRDIYDAFQDEVYKLAENEVKKLERIVADQLSEGCWDKALSDFIEDFCVFPVAVMKGPIVNRKKKIEWEDGKPVVKDHFVFLNKRVSPLDIYPSANSTDVQDGNLCEHLRLQRSELYELIGVEGYNEENIRDILENTSPGNYQWLDSYIEEEKVVEEYRGDSFYANTDVYHGIHFYGKASGEMLKEFGFDESFLNDDPLYEYDIDAILVVDKVIKVEINEDPLLRRPYYKASFQNIPGSWWGRSLPELMRDIQRMCNATARALSNNMGISSGPQVEVYVDRLAADEDIENMYPWKLWQVSSDPTGSGGRAVQFWQPSSNAQELLAVYKEFEIRADDATGVPRYAYGNERTGGAAQTAHGLSLLLESANKGIKDAIRHIDDGLVKPRIQYEFYWILTSDPDLNFSGDIIVEPKGSEALTMKGAQEQRRNEFLNILANESMMQIVGIEGIADILREMAKSLGLGHNIIPSRVQLKFQQAQNKIEQAKAQQMQAEAEAAKEDQNLKAVQMQVEQAEAASSRNAELKQLEMQLKKAIEDQKAQLKALEIQQREMLENAKNEVKLIQQQMADSQKDRTTNKNIALSVESNYRDKNNQE